MPFHCKCTIEAKPSEKQKKKIEKMNISRFLYRRAKLSFMMSMRHEAWEEIKRKYISVRLADPQHFLFLCRALRRKPSNQNTFFYQQQRKSDASRMDRWLAVAGHTDTARRNINKRILVCAHLKETFRSAQLVVTVHYKCLSLSHRSLLIIRVTSPANSTKSTHGKSLVSLLSSWLFGPLLPSRQCHRVTSHELSFRYHPPLCLGSTSAQAACTRLFLFWNWIKCHSREESLLRNELTTCNAQFLLIHHWILFYFRPVFDRSERASRAQNVSGRNIYAVGIAGALVCIERYIGTFLYFFPRCFTILFLSSERSRVLACRSEARSRVGQRHRAQHSTAQRKNISRRRRLSSSSLSVGARVLWASTEEIYKSVYWNSTNETSSDGARTALLHVGHRFFPYALAESGLARSSRDQRKSAPLEFILSSLRLFFSFTSKHIKITSSIDSIQSQTVTVEFEKGGEKYLEPKAWWKTLSSVSKARSIAPVLRGLHAMSFRTAPKKVWISLSLACSFLFLNLISTSGARF